MRHERPGKRRPCADITLFSEALSNRSSRAAPAATYQVTITYDYRTTRHPPRSTRGDDANNATTAHREPGNPGAPSLILKQKLPLRLFGFCVSFEVFSARIERSALPAIVNGPSQRDELPKELHGALTIGAFCHRDPAPFELRTPVRMNRPLVEAGDRFDLRPTPGNQQGSDAGPGQRAEAHRTRAPTHAELVHW